MGACVRFNGPTNTHTLARTLPSVLVGVCTCVFDLHTHTHTRSAQNKYKTTGHGLAEWLYEYIIIVLGHLYLLKRNCRIFVIAAAAVAAAVL